MNQVIEQTHEDKVKMYSKLNKKELIEMLIEANKHLTLKPLTWVDNDLYPKPTITFNQT